MMVDLAEWDRRVKPVQSKLVYLDPRSFLLHITCLVEVDREKVDCDTRNYGNRVGMLELLCRLRNRPEGFEQLVTTLRHPDVNRLDLVEAIQGALQKENCHSKNVRRTLSVQDQQNDLNCDHGECTSLPTTGIYNKPRIHYRNITEDNIKQKHSRKVEASVLRKSETSALNDCRKSNTSDTNDHNDADGEGRDEDIEPQTVEASGITNVYIETLNFQQGSQNIMGMVPNECSNHDTEHEIGPDEEMDENLDFTAVKSEENASTLSVINYNSKTSQERSGGPEYCDIDPIDQHVLQAKEVEDLDEQQTVQKTHMPPTSRRRPQPYLSENADEVVDDDDKVFEDNDSAFVLSDLDNSKIVSGNISSLCSSDLDIGSEECCKTGDKFSVTTSQMTGRLPNSTAQSVESNYSDCHNSITNIEVPQLVEEDDKDSDGKIPIQRGSLDTVNDLNNKDTTRHLSNSFNIQDIPETVTEWNCGENSLKESSQNGAPDGGWAGMETDGYYHEEPKQPELQIPEHIKYLKQAGKLQTPKDIENIKQARELTISKDIENMKQARELTISKDIENKKQANELQIPKDIKCTQHHDKIPISENVKQSQMPNDRNATLSNKSAEEAREVSVGSGWLVQNFIPVVGAIAVFAVIIKKQLQI